MDLFDGPGGWVRAASLPRPPGTSAHGVFVQLVNSEDGWAPNGVLYVPGVTAEELRRLPFRRILLAIGANEALTRDLAERLDEPVPPLGSGEFFKAFNGYAHEVPLELERPAGRRLPESFYATVADTYRAAVLRGLNPRTTIAELANVSTEVAGRWVREARKREFLPATEPGKVRA